MEVEQRFGVVAIAHEIVEGRECDRARLPGAIEQVGVGVPVPLRDALDRDGHGDALAHQGGERALPAVGPPVEERAELSDRGDPASAQLTIEHLAGDRTGPTRRLAHRKAPLRQVPEPLLPVAPDDHHLALVPEHVEQHRDVPSFVVPAPRVPPVGDPILEVARTQRSARTQLAKHVPTERRVGREPLRRVLPSLEHPLRPLVGIAPHRLAMDPVVGGRHDVHPVFEERPVDPEHALELFDAEPAAQPREQHEVLGAGHDPGGVELHHREVVHRLGDGGGARSGEALPLHAQPPGRAAIDAEGRRTGHRRAV